jgi:hypothetical protein
MKLPNGLGRLSYIGRQHRHIRQMAVFVIEIQPVAHDEVVGNIETAVIRLQVNLLSPDLAQQHRHAH